LELVLIFAAALLAAVLLSGLAERTIISAAVLFLVVGFAVSTAGLVELEPGDPRVVHLAELALFSVLFTDGMRVGVQDLVSAWRLPGRALILGLPLTLGITAVIAHYVAGLPWMESLLVGAVLSPTDPVFASAIVGREEVPGRLRHLLNVESGLNDGLALPIVVVLLAVAGGRDAHFVTLLEEIAFGIALGVLIPWGALLLERIERPRFFSLSEDYEPLYALAIGLLVLALAYVTHANLFLAAFAAGITTVTVSPRFRDAFHRFGELLTELLKLAAILVFGILVSLSFLAEIEVGGYVFALLVIFAVRPIALGLSLVGSRLGGRETAAAAWFGPKGFASVVYGILVLESGIAQADEMFHLIAVVIAVSIVLHSSTDVLVARWLKSEDRAAPER
jgi:NhaP-type Na+/H+ or K+/H+ antiporter